MLNSVNSCSPASLINPIRSFTMQCLIRYLALPHHGWYRLKLPTTVYSPSTDLKDKEVAYLQVRLLSSPAGVDNTYLLCLLVLLSI